MMTVSHSPLNKPIGAALWNHPLVIPAVTGRMLLDTNHISVVAYQIISHIAGWLQLLLLQNNER